MTAPPGFPPLLKGVATQGDPFAEAQAHAARGCDGGTLVHHVAADRLRAAIVFAPEVPLAEAMAMLPVCGIGFQNALGALAPPEVAVALTWDGRVRVNGATCGGLRVAAPGRDETAVPDWLVVGLEVAVRRDGVEPGERPETTDLFEEGCGAVCPERLLEAWARHMLVWLHRWSGEGAAPVHREWTGMLAGLGEDVARGGHEGRFLGVDERFGMLIREGATTRLRPLTDLLEGPR